MRAKSVVQVRTPAGLVDAPCFYQWKHDVGGMDFEFALCIASGHTKGFQAPLAIHELSTGFNIKAVMMHPNSRNPLTDKSVESMTSAQVRKLARAAFHRKIFVEVGQLRFLQSVVGAQMLIAKVDGRIKPDPVVRPAIPYPAPEVPVVMPNQASCLACEDSRVLTTTDKDHEGQPIEIACTECIPGGDQYIPSPEEHAAAIADADRMNQNMREHGTIDAPKPSVHQVTSVDATQEIEDLEATPCSK